MLVLEDDVCTNEIDELDEVPEDVDMALELDELCVLDAGLVLDTEGDPLEDELDIKLLGPEELGELCVLDSDELELVLGTDADALEDEVAIGVPVPDELFEVTELDIVLVDEVATELLELDGLLEVPELDIVLVVEGAIMVLVLDDVRLTDTEELVETPDDEDVVLGRAVDEELVV